MLVLVVTVLPLGNYDGLAPGGVASFVESIAGAMLRLNDWEQVRLYSPQTSNLPLGGLNFKTCLLGNKIKDALARLACCDMVKPWVR